MEETLEQLLRDAYREGFYKARERYVIMTPAPRLQRFFEYSAVRQNFKALMGEMRGVSE